MNRYILLIVSIFLGISSTLLLIQSANQIYYQVNNLDYAYYWLDYRLAFIQSPNSMLNFAGILASVLGVFTYSEDLDIENVSISSFIFAVVSVVVSLIVLFFFNKISFQSISINIYTRSFLSFLGYIQFIFFWYYTGFILRHIIKKRILVIISLTALQIFEIYYVPFYNFDLSPVLKYLPTTLSRELVICNFNYWEHNSWLSNMNSFFYANATPIVSFSKNPRVLTTTHVYFMLFIYLLIPTLIFIFMERKNHDKLRLQRNNTNASIKQ